jgi:hypothetical protein
MTSRIIRKPADPAHEPTPLKPELAADSKARPSRKLILLHRLLMILPLLFSLILTFHALLLPNPSLHLSVLTIHPTGERLARVPNLTGNERPSTYGSKRPNDGAKMEETGRLGVGYAGGGDEAQARRSCEWIAERWGRR